MHGYLKKLITILNILMILLLVGCGSKPTFLSETTPTTPPAITPEAKGENTSFTKDFGTYTLPSDWVEVAEHSTDNKFFYVIDGTEKDAQPDNISVESGKNQYSAAEHEKFRDAITNQLAMQLNGISANVSGSGFYTANNYTVYKFTIEEEDIDIVTTQYYIVSDYKYVLVHETAKKDAIDANEAAVTIMDSFTWAEN